MRVNYRYPWGSGKERRNAIMREIYDLDRKRKLVAKTGNFKLMNKISKRIRSLRRTLGEKQWGKG